MRDFNMAPIAALLVGLACTATTFAQGKVESARLGNFEYQSHFEPNAGAAADSGSRDGWESFPISQEAGYDPSIQPLTTHGTSALTRELAPTQDGLFQLGFIRRVHLVAGRDASVKMRLRVPYLAGATAVHISIFRGEQEERHEAKLVGDGWQTVECPIASSPKPLTAVAIAVDFPAAVRGRVEKVEMTDVHLTALATRRILLAAPQAMWDESRELYYLQHAVHAGEEVGLRFDVGTRRNVRWTLQRASGEVAAEGIGGEMRYRMPSDASAGIWSWHLFDGEAESTALMLVRAAHPVGLLFDQAPAIPAALLATIRERRALLEKTTQPETGMNVAKMDPHWLLAGLPSYFSIILQPSELAMLDAMEFRATGDPAALDHSRKLLASIARWPEWVHPWFPAHGYHSYYPVGIMTKYVVMAEQFLGNDLPVDERQRLDRSLMDLSVKPIYMEYVFEDRLQFDTSNWIGNTVGGALLAALQSEDPAAAGYALGLFVKERDHVKAAYTSDGSYGEGVTYHRFDLEMTEMVAGTAKRLLGTSIDQPLLEGDRYMRYAAYGKDGLLDYGDSHVDITPSNVFAYVAALNRSPSMTDFYFKYRDPGAPELLSKVLWETAIQPANAPAPQPPSRLFDQRGIVVLRDGWDADANVIAMRAGRNFNHNHADEGSIFYARNGVLWLGEAGYADYYKDPSYPTFNIQAIGHNTLLVDGDEQSQSIPGNAVFGTSPSVTHALIGDKVSLVQADLTTAYQGKVQRYTRSLFYQAHGALVVIDQVEAGSPHTFTQLWHPKQPVASLTPANNSFSLQNGAMRLTVRAFSNQALSTARRPSPLPLVSYEQAEHGSIEDPMHVEISTTKPSTEATIVTLIDPDEHAASQAKWSANGETRSLDMGDSGIDIRHGEGSPGTSVLAWRKGGAMLIGGTSYKDHDTGASVSTDHPVDLTVARLAGGEVRMTIHANASTSLTLQRFRVLEGCGAPAGCVVSSPRKLMLAAGETSLLLRVEAD